MMWLECLVALCLGAVVYSYTLYPLVLWVVAGWRQAWRDAHYVWSKLDRRLHEDLDDWPEVAVVISAYNEQTHIDARIANLLALDYPAEKLRCYIGSDGSSDDTARRLMAVQDERVLGFAFEQNRGKASVLNDLVGRTQAPILVFSDANTFFHRDALKRLVRHFASPAIGGVSGELRLLDAQGGDNQDGLYWRLEQFLKFFESRLGALLGANGAIYAIRREYWAELPADTICDDFCVAMNVSARRGRLVYDPTACADEEVPPAIADEYNRRVRIGIGNFQALLRQPEYLTRTTLATAFAYVSHKVLRWIAPHLILVALVASAILASQSVWWAAFTGLQVLGLGLAAAAYRRSSRGGRLGGMMRIVAFLYAIHWAFLVASWRYCTGQYRGAWHRSAR